MPQQKRKLPNKLKKPPDWEASHKTRCNYGSTLNPTSSQPPLAPQ